jgi:hypothetical protein
MIARMFGILFFLFAAVASARASDGPEFVGIRVGLGDRYKAGLWTSVDLTLRGGSTPLTGAVSVTVPDGDGTPSQVITPPSEAVKLAAGETVVVRTLARFGRVRSQLRADFLVDGKSAVQKTFAASDQADQDRYLEAIDGRPLWIAVGNSDIGLDEAAKLRSSSSTNDPNAAKNRPAYARVGAVEQLPTHWCGYEGVDALVIATSDAKMLDGFAPNDVRIMALDDWVRMGGRLVLCVGARAKKVLTDGAPLARFAPGRFETILTRDQTSGWEQFCRSSSPVPQANAGQQFSIICPKLAVAEGVELREEDLPLVVRTARGFGQIIFVAADIDRPPFSDWSDRGLLLAKLLDVPTAGNSESREEQYQGAYGYTDLSGQLRSSLDSFKDVSAIPFALVAAIIVAYILLIGPGDYFLLKKLVRRMTWTWATFPVIAIVVGAGAFAISDYLKGSQLRVCQADLVDVDVAAHAIRGTTWANIFCPRAESLDLSLQPQPIPAKGDPVAATNPAPTAQSSGYFAWLGLPGAGLGGMNSNGVDAGCGWQSYRLWPDTEQKPPSAYSIEGVPIGIGSTKSFTGRWRAAAETVPLADLTEEQQDVIGTITNPYAFPLGNCIVAHDRWVYKLDTIAPGETKSINTTTDRNELRNYLTGMHMVKEDKLTSRQETTPFEMYNRDPAYILRTMMFYQRAGGSTYAHLSNDYQSFVDLSNLLDAGRAILVAEALRDEKAAGHGAVLLRGGGAPPRGDDRHTVIYRFVLPVKRK